MKFTAPNLTNTIADLRAAIGNEKTMPILAHILIETGTDNITMTASDGHRLATTKINANHAAASHYDCIIPIKSALLIAKLFKTGEITLSFNSDQLRIDNGNTVLTCKAIDGKFPDFSKPFNAPKSLQTEIDSEQFAACIETASITAIGQFRSVSLTVDNNTLSAASHNAHGEESSDSAECSHDGDAYTLGFNATYLIASAKHITGMMYINTDGNSLLTLEPRDRTVTYLIMPARI